MSKLDDEYDWFISNSGYIEPKKKARRKFSDLTFKEIASMVAALFVIAIAAPWILLASLIVILILWDLVSRLI